MFNKNIDLREWREWVGLLFAIFGPVGAWALKDNMDYIVYFVCTGTAIILFYISIFVKGRKVRKNAEEKDRLNKMLSQRWNNWGDDELSKNPEAWETLKDYLEDSFRVNNVPDKIRHKILFSLEDIIDYLSHAWTPMKDTEIKQ